MVENMFFPDSEHVRMGGMLYAWFLEISFTR